MKKNTHTNKNVTTIVNIVLDKSASMGSCREGTIEGFNSYIKKLKEEDANILVSLTLFDTGVQKRYSLIPIKEVALLDYSSYAPSGCTALWDAAVDSTEECYERTKGMIENKPAILSVIITDGEENSSRRHERECMNDLVEKLQGEGNWSFIYLGANQDSWSNASKVGMSMGNVANFRSNDDGMRSTFSAMAMATSDLSLSASKGIMRSSSLLSKVKGENNELT